MVDRASAADSTVAAVVGIVVGQDSTVEVDNVVIVAALWAVAVESGSPAHM